MSRSWSAETFDRLYTASDDPWDFQTSSYEQAKYRATLAALPAGRFSAAFEAGCSIGVLTRMLALRCERLLAVDVSGIALRLARERCQDLSWVQFAQMALPQSWPDGAAFDLMVFSEVLYFFNETDIRRAAARTATCLAPGGSVILVNWIGTTNTPNTGDTAAKHFIRASGLAVTLQRRAPGYRLDVLANGT